MDTKEDCDMTKKVETKISLAAVNAVSKALSDAYDSMAKSGSLVHIVYTVCKKVYKRKAIPVADRKAILDKLALARKWTEASGRIRRNEADNIMKAYMVIPELSKKFAAKTPEKAIAWHEVVKVCRAYNKLGKVDAAVKAALLATPKAIPANKLTRKQAKAKVAASVKTILTMTGLEPKFRHALAELCETHKINL